MRPLPSLSALLPTHPVSLWSLGNRRMACPHSQHPHSTLQVPVTWVLWRLRSWPLHEVLWGRFAPAALHLPSPVTLPSRSMTMPGVSPSAGPLNLLVLPPEPFAHIHPRPAPAQEGSLHPGSLCIPTSCLISPPCSVAAKMTLLTYLFSTLLCGKSPLQTRT